MIKKDKFIYAGQAGGCYDDVPCIIRGGLGEGKPMINESQIWFNGNAKTGMDHETFGIQWEDEGEGYNLKFMEGDNQEVRVVGSSMFLYDTDADAGADGEEDHTQITILTTKELE
jgi:hypothetical protein